MDRSEKGLRHHNHLARAYGLDTPKKTLDFYADWAKTYDAEVLANGYATPGRCAQALKRHAGSPSLAILDIGCGTGLSGKALNDAGFSNIEGSEVSPEMLEIARSRNLYRNVWLADQNAPYPFETGHYDAITAIGVIGAGAAPLPVLEGALSKLDTGGLCVFSFNDHTLEDPSFENCVEMAVNDGGFELLESEYGPHLPGKNLGAKVYVVRKVGK